MYCAKKNSLFEKGLTVVSCRYCHAEVPLTRLRLAEKQIKATDKCQKLVVVKHTVCLMLIKGQVESASDSLLGEFLTHKLQMLARN